MQGAEEAHNKLSNNNHSPKYLSPLQMWTSNEWPMPWPLPFNRTKDMALADQEEEDLADQEQEDLVDQEDPHKNPLVTSSPWRTRKMFEP